MAISFNADEIFEMAIEIEKNGAKFYTEAAQNVKDLKTRQMLAGMAAMENNHRKTFEEMRKQLSQQEMEPTVFDPDNESAMYLQTMAEGHGWEGKASLEQKLTGRETIQDILKSAIRAEKDSVVFYVGLKDLVSAKAGKDKVEAVIKEELGHLAALNEQLAALK